MNPGTLKKSVPKKGRKCKGQETSQFCRICYRPFPISYGNFPTCKTGYISTENIFMVPQKKGLTKPLSSYFGDLSFHLDLGEQFQTMFVPLAVQKLELQRLLLKFWRQTWISPPCVGVQNERSKRMSNSPHQAQQSKILRNSRSLNKFGAKRLLLLGGMENENVDPEELRSSEGICWSLGCEVFQADMVKEPCIHDELTTLHHEKQQKTELTVLFSDPNSEFSEEGSTRSVS